MKMRKRDEFVEKMIKRTAYAFFGIYNISWAYLVYAYVTIRQGL